MNDFKSLVQAIGPVLLLSNSPILAKICIAIAMFFADTLGSKLVEWAKPTRVCAKLESTMSGSNGTISTYEMCTEMCGLNTFVHDLVLSNKVDTSKLVIVTSRDIQVLMSARNCPVYLSANSSTYIDLTDDIYCNIVQNSNTSSGDDNKKSVTTVTIRATMYSRSNDAHSLMAMLKAFDGLDKKKSNERSARQEIRILKQIGATPQYDYFDFQSTMKFDNIFFEGKSRLVGYLDEFVTNKARYVKLGIPYTIGMLFHGAPGTGKTSTIKAIANYTKRSIVCLDPNKINTREKLFSLLSSSSRSQDIYVFEEIDCGAWKHILAGRSVANDEHIQQDETSDIAKIASLALSAMKDKAKTEEDTTNFTLKLSDILEVMDGMVDMSGRMIIMTTNHPDMLDRALLRPGRIDHVIEFKNMTKDNICDLYRLWFGVALPTDVYNCIEDYKFSQAMVCNMFKKYDNDQLMQALMGRLDDADVTSN